MRRSLLALVALSALSALSVLAAPAGALPPEQAGPPEHGTATPVGTWPLRPEPEVVRAFDPPLEPWGPGHRGVDLLGSPGQAVRAGLDGTVTYAGNLAGRGVVVVSHGDTRTTYEPVEPSVDVGAAVAPGERLGALQTGPSHCAPRTCLHWGWIDGGWIHGGWIEGTAYLDPLRLVGRGPVRLLPFLSGPRPTVHTHAAPRRGAGTGTGPPLPTWW